jgi:RHS repeat-associated protein
LKKPWYISGRKEKSSLKRKKRGFGGVRKFSGILFELPNHLGNVLVTISDRKIAANTTIGQAVTYYKPVVVTANDYYPFGMIMPGRSYTGPSAGSGRYRYGFNGKENDSEVKGEGNQVAFEARIYDPRLGRFLSTDPLEEAYVFQSTYVFAANNPVTLIDVFGMGPGKGFSASDRKKGEVATVVGKRTPREGEERVNTYLVSVNVPVGFNAMPFNGRKTIVQIVEAKRLEVYHRGSKYFPKGWMSEDEYSLTKIDWEGGQVMHPFVDDDGPVEDFFERLAGIDGDIPEAEGLDEEFAKESNLGKPGTGRNWNGLQVNHAGYVTGRVYLEKKVYEARLNFRSATRALSTLSRLMMTGPRNRFRVLSQIQNSKLRNIVNAVWRKNAQIGNGSSMDAFRFDGSHQQKLLDVYGGLKNLLYNHRKGRMLLNKSDMKLTKRLMVDVINALRGN